MSCGALIGDEGLARLSNLGCKIVDFFADDSEDILRDLHKFSSVFDGFLRVEGDETVDVWDIPGLGFSRESKF